jgi:Ca-activated chloride channel family protein
VNGLSFLSPLGLIGLISIPIVVILYMRTTTPGQRRIPTTRFWKDALTTPSETRRFRPPPITPLFIIHILAALLLTLALARPASAQILSRFGSRTEPKHVILVVDGSTSMSAIADPVHAPHTTRFDLARDHIRNRLGDLHNGDVATVLLLGTQTTTYQASDSVDIGHLSIRLADVPVPGGRADLNAALRLCKDLLLPGMNDEIVIVTDGALSVDPTLAAQTGAPILLDLVTGNGPDDNLAITEISARGSSDEPGRQDLYLRVVNFSTAVTTSTVKITADSVDVSTIDISLDPGSSRTVTQRLPAGTIRAVASLSTSDAQPADDSASLTLGGDGASGIRIALISDNPSSLLRALNALPGSHVDVLSTNQYLAAGGPGDVDLVVFEGNVPAAALASLPMLVVNPGPDFGTAVGTMAAPTPLRVVAQSPLLLGVDLAGVTFGQTTAYQLGANDTEIVGADQGPLLYQSTASNGEPEIVLPFDIAQSNFPLRVSFPILVSNLVNNLVARSVPASLSVGDPLIVNLRSAASSATVIDPALGSHQFASDQLVQVAGTHQITYVDTGQPGLYQVQELDDSGAILTTSLVSINAGHPQESNLKPNPLLAQALVSGNAATVSSQSRNAVDLWPVIMAVVLGLLLVEWILTLRSQRQIRIGRTGAAG